LLFVHDEMQAAMEIFPTELTTHRVNDPSRRRVFIHRSHNGSMTSNLDDFNLLEFTCYNMNVSYQLWVHLIFMSQPIPNATFPPIDLLFYCLSSFSDLRVPL